MVAIYFLFNFLAASIGQASTINFAVARVGEQVITARAVLLSHAFDEWKLRENVTESNSWNIPLTVAEVADFDRRASIWVLETMILLEAESFGLQPQITDEVQKEARAWQQHYSKNTDWQRLDADIAELEKIVSIKQRVLQHLQFKNESAPTQISESDARAFFERNRSKFGALSFEAVAENVKTYLLRDQASSRLKEWFETLRKKYRVRFLPRVEPL